MAERPRHIPELDGLRAVAALMVRALHTGLTPGGSTGVDVFFVLSGWLITGILAREIDRTGAVDWIAFIARRVRRLWPALLAMLAFCLAIWPRAWADAIAAAAYIADFTVLAGPNSGPFAPAWTLAVEWQFYLVWPLFLLVALRLGRSRAAAIMVAAWAVLGLVRAPLLLSGPGFAADLAYYSPLHASGLLLGAALALRPVRAPAWAGWIGLLVTAATLAIPHAGDAWSIPLAELSAALVVAAPPRALAFPPLVRLGEISYGVYLWQIPAWLLLRAALPPPASGLATILLAIAAAALSWRYVERPFMRRGRNYPVNLARTGCSDGAA